MTNPPITVFIPTFNRLKRLKAAVESVRSQGDFLRLHVLDNASEDGTGEWLKQLKATDPRVHLTLRTTNLGGARNFLDGFEAVTTPYLVPLADDDELAPGFLASALRTADADPTLAAVVFVTESRRGRTVSHSPPCLTPGRVEPGEHLRRWANHGHYVSWSSVLWRTVDIRSHVMNGEFTRFGAPGDVWIQFLVFSQGPAFLHSDVGSIFNEHDGQVSKTVSLDVIGDYGRLIDEAEKTMSETGVLDPDQQRFVLQRMCMHATGYFRFLSERVPLPLGDNVLRRYLDTYSQHFVPRVGYAAFPLLPLFEQHREMGETLHELQTQAASSDHLRRSLTWRFASRLAGLERRTRVWLPTSVKAWLRTYLSGMRNRGTR